jgi:hypothetical protein
MTPDKQAREALVEAEFWLDGALQCKTWNWDAAQHDAASSSLEKIRTALTTPPPSPVTDERAKVRVRKLEWVEDTSARSDENPTFEPTGDYEAETPFGTYYIEQYFGSDSYGWKVILSGFGEIADRDDPEDAKASAQADFERRILAALEPAEEGR